MAENGEAWGPWVVHDGRGCPVAAGTIVEVVCRDGFGFDQRVMGCASGGEESSWDWSHYPRLKKIIRYRVKRPRGMAMLIEAMDTLPVKAPEKPVDA